MDDKTTPPHGETTASAVSPPCKCRDNDMESHCCFEAIRGEVLRRLQNISQNDLVDHRNRFIPRTKLLELFSLENVIHLLEHYFDQSQFQEACSGATVQSYAKFICPTPVCLCKKESCTGARVIFAALILIAREDRMNKFYQDGKCDSTLEARGVEAILDQEIADLFNHVRWPMQSPFFEQLDAPSQSPLEIDSHLTLPWTSLDQTRLEDGDRQGEFAVVWKIAIHADHHNLEGGNDSFYALKAFKPTVNPKLRKIRFRQELDAIKRLGAPHNRIVRLLCAFEYRGIPYLVFPWADGGTLLDLWKSNPTTPFTRYSTKWLLEQCLGLVDGLVWMHGHDPAEPGQVPPTSQIHADITPENILLFSSTDDHHGPHLKLADFGLSRELKENTPTKSLRGTITYRPPESELDLRQASLKWDIWCLGCLYLEFFTWFLLGNSQVEEFINLRAEDMNDPRASDATGHHVSGAQGQEDSFFQVKVANPWLSRLPCIKLKVTVVTKKSVTEHTRRLKDNARDRGALTEFLKFIEERMLVVDDVKRADSIAVRAFISQISSDTNGEGR